MKKSYSTNIIIYYFGKNSDITNREKELLKRINFFTKTEIISIPQAGIKTKNKNKIQEIEYKNLKEKIGKTPFIIFDENGEEKNSTKFSEQIEFSMEGKESVILVLGGAYGFSEKTKTEAQQKLSLGKLTWTRDLARQMVIEQLYRAFQINNNQNFHKE